MCNMKVWDFIFYGAVDIAGNNNCNVTQYPLPTALLSTVAIL